MGLLGREIPTPRGTRKPSTMVPLCSSSRHPRLCLWDPCGTWLVGSSLRAALYSREASPCPAPQLVAACTSAFLEHVCIGDICIFDAFKNLFSL